MGIIEIDFIEARKQAGRLNDLAGDLSKLLDQDYVSAMEQISANWTGESSEKYIQKGAALQGEIEDTVEAIRKVAGGILLIVDNLEKAQREAQAVISGKNF